MRVTASVFHKRIMFESIKIVCASRFMFLSVLTCHCINEKLRNLLEF
jgi:hypothetical protein